MVLCCEYGRTLRPYEMPELVDDAEALKGAMLQLKPEDKQDWGRMLSLAPAF